MMKIRTNFYRLFTLSLAFLLLTACAPKNTPPPTEAPVAVDGVATTPPTQPTVVPAINADLYLDPALTQDPDSLMISEYLYEGLVHRGPNGEVLPGLASSWRVSDDQLDYKFDLQSGAAFSDGTPITPDIIVDNFNRWFDPQSPLHGSQDFATWKRIFFGFHAEIGPDKRPVSPIDGIQKVDSNTILIHLNRPEPNTLRFLADPAFAILKPDALNSSDYGKRGSTIISSGPYVVSNWSDAGLTLSPNPKYWGVKPTGDLNFVWR
ncbi:MAG: ABC transporter substrate-binding protein [Anaerolineales bacterium]